MRTFPHYNKFEIQTPQGSLSLYGHPGTPNIKAQLEVCITARGLQYIVMLDQDQVDALVPVLAFFAERGDVPDKT